MKLKDIFEAKQSGELARVKKLFRDSFKTFLSSKSRDTKLDFLMDVIDDAIGKSDKKHLILKLQRSQQRKKK